MPKLNQGEPTSVIEFKDIFLPLVAVIISLVTVRQLEKAADKLTSGNYPFGSTAFWILSFFALEIALIIVSVTSSFFYKVKINGMDKSALKRLGGVNAILLVVAGVFIFFTYQIYFTASPYTGFWWIPLLIFVSLNIHKLKSLNDFVYKGARVLENRR